MLFVLPLPVQLLRRYCYAIRFSLVWATSSACMVSDAVMYVTALLAATACLMAMSFILIQANRRAPPAAVAMVFKYLVCEIWW